MSYSRPPPRIEGMVSLKVDNLTYRTTPEDLRRVFERCGEVGDIYIPRDRFTRESRGFAFVRYLHMYWLFVTCRRTVSRRRRLQKWLQYSCWARYKTMYCVHKSRTSPFIGSRFLFWWQYAMIQNFDLIWFAASRNDFDCTRDGIEIIVITSFYAYRFYDKRDAEDALDAMDGRMLDGRELRVQMARYGRPTSPYRRRRRRYDFPIYNYQIYFTP